MVKNVGAFWALGPFILVLLFSGRGPFDAEIVLWAAAGSFLMLCLVAFYGRNGSLIVGFLLSMVIALCATVLFSYLFALCLSEVEPYLIHQFYLSGWSRLVSENAMLILLLIGVGTLCKAAVRLFQRYNM